jgi:hypothetical protein
VALCPHAYDYDFILIYPALALCIAQIHRRSGLTGLTVLLAWLAVSFAYVATKRFYLDEAALWWIPWVACALTSLALAYLWQRSSTTSDAATAALQVSS